MRLYELLPCPRNLNAINIECDVDNANLSRPPRRSKAAKKLSKIQSEIDRDMTAKKTEIPFHMRNEYYDEDDYAADSETELQLLDRKVRQAKSRQNRQKTA